MQRDCARYEIVARVLTRNDETRYLRYAAG